MEEFLIVSVNDEEDGVDPGTGVVVVVVGGAAVLESAFAGGDSEEEDVDEADLV